MVKTEETRKVQKWGNSLGCRLPKQLLEETGISQGSMVIVSVSKDGKSIMIKPQGKRKPVRGRHKIEDLIAASDPKALKTFEDGFGEPQGEEVW